MSTLWDETAEKFRKVTDRLGKVDPFVKTGGKAVLRATLLHFLSSYC
jgi:hypothetical protein